MENNKLENLGNGCFFVVLLLLLIFFIGLKLALNPAKEIKTEKNITLEEALIK